MTADPKENGTILGGSKIKILKHETTLDQKQISSAPPETDRLLPLTLSSAA